MENLSVINKLSEFIPAKNSKSLLQLIKEASTVTEVKYFLGLGDSYKSASNKTKKLWEKAAKKRIVELK